MADSSAMDLKQSRKWMIEINNPLDHNFSHDQIQEIMSSVRGASLYWCMCDEEGGKTHTYHTHIFIFRRSPFTARQIDNLFPKMNRLVGYGTCEQCRAYVLKDGDKFNKQSDGHYDYTDKKGVRHFGINFSDTFFEFGECPSEHQGVSTNDDIVMELIRKGATNEDIVDAVSSAYKNLEKIDRVRSMYRDSEFVKKWRDLYVTYMFGKTGSGKTRSVMEKYGYENCYRVTDYKHPFDTYDGQDVLIFEEFRSGLKHGDMLNYLDGYPLLLPCRYYNRQACYTKVYILSNLPPDAQYVNVDDESRFAFFRRINKVIEFGAFGQTEYESVRAYVHRYDWVQKAIDAPGADFKSK